MSYFTWSSSPSSTRILNNVTVTDQRSLRILIVGAAGVGKTCLLSCLLLESPISSLPLSVPTRSCNPQVKKYGENWLEFLEIGGQFHHAKSNLCLYKKYDAIIAVFDVTDIASFARLEEFLSPALDYRKGEPILLVGTRLDLLASSGFYYTTQSYQTHPYYQRLVSLGAQAIAVSLLEGMDQKLLSGFYEQICQNASCRNARYGGDGQYAVKIE